MTPPLISEQLRAQRPSALPKVPDHPHGAQARTSHSPMGRSSEEPQAGVTGVRGPRTPVPTHPAAMGIPSSG